MTAGLIAADAAVRRELTTPDRLLTEVESRRLGYAAYRVADLASGLSESPGESWTRMVLAGFGLEAQQQVEIRDDHGRFVARVDFLLAELGVVVEFDDHGLPVGVRSARLTGDRDRVVDGRVVGPGRRRAD